MGFWKKTRPIIGIALVSFFSALLGWSFSLPWEYEFLWLFAGILVGAGLMSWD